MSIKIPDNIAIAIPAFNAQDKILDVINCIQDQYQLDPHQLVLINDGSTDNSESIIKKYSDLRIKCEPNLVDIKPEFASNAISVQTGDVQQTGTEIFTESSHVKKELKCDGIKRIPKSRKQVKYFSEIVDHDTTKARVVGETAYNEHLYNLFQKKQQEGLRIRNSKN